MGARLAITARVAGGLALMGACLAGPFAAPALAQCELSEQLTVSPSSARPGQPVTVLGKSFSEGCTDGSGNIRPARSVAIVFSQAGKETQLALVNAGPAPGYAFSVKVTIPAGATAGPANISARSAAAIFTVEAGAWVAQPATESGAAGGAPLPSTGSDGSALAAVATGLFVAGSGCVVDLICIAMLLSIYHLGYDLILLTAAAVALAGGTLPAWVAPRFRRALLIGVAILAANYLTAETILVHLRDHRLWLLVASINCGLLLLLFTGYVIQAFRAPPAGTHPA